jgi:hypothetical protein
MVVGMMAWIMVIMKGREEMAATGKAPQKRTKKKKAERRRSDARTKALEVYRATDWEQTTDENYTEEVEYYYEEEREYDEEYCAYYYQDYIEERNRNTRKQLYLRSQPAQTLRPNRLEKEMQLRRKQREEQATEVQVIIYERIQQQKQKNKDDKKRKKITKQNHAIGWIREWLTLLTQLDGTGGREQ